MQDKLIAEARSYLGIPWVHQGRTKKGVDCVGFILLSMWSLGIKTEEIKGYSRQPDGVLLKHIMDNQPAMRPIGKDEKPEKGDIVLFRIRKHPQHVALLTDSNTAELGMIHSYNGGQKKVIEHDFADYWRKKAVQYYRLK